MPKLNQVIAIAAGKKKHALSELTKIHHILQKPALLDGISRTYRPKDEDGESRPPEKKNVQFTAREGIQQAVAALTEMIDVVAQQDEANRIAAADVNVDGKAVVKMVPVSTLLFLEKQLVDLHTFVDKLPVLDPAETWEFDPSTNCFRSEPSETTSSKKVPRNHVLYEATKEHPAQVQMFTEDHVAGHWTTTKFSGAVEAKKRADTLARIRKLQEAVKCARESANNTEAPLRTLAKPLFEFVFGEQV